MDSENGVLTREQALKLNELLAGGTVYDVENLNELLLHQITYFIQSKAHLFNIYRFRLDNTRTLNLKSSLKYLLDSMSMFEGNRVRVSFIGPENDRIMIFSDVNFDTLLGVIGRDDSDILSRTIGT